MAVSFSTKTVPAPDNSLPMIDVGSGEYVGWKLDAGPMLATAPKGFRDIALGMWVSLAGGPSTGNYTMLSTDYLAIWFAAGTDYSPASSSFFGVGIQMIGTWTGYDPGGGNIRFNCSGRSAYRKNGSDTLGGFSSPNYVARDETGSIYPNLNAFVLSEYVQDHLFLQNWPCYGVEAYTPKKVRDMHNFGGQWTPRDFVNEYFNLELGIGARASNPSTANIYPDDQDYKYLDSIFIENSMTSGAKFRFAHPIVSRSRRPSLAA